MTVEATPKNIEWLVERLYECRRTLEASQVCHPNHPTFVLITHGKNDRHEVEELMYRYFFNKYGIDSHHMMPIAADATMTCFEMAEAGCRVVLMDV